MSRLIILLILLSLRVFAQSDEETASRKAALDLAGAFSNDGFKIRDGNYTATLTKGAPQIVEVNLYAGNAYWFIAASGNDTTKLAISVYDETGKALKVQRYGDGPRAAANLCPQVSGPYYLYVAEAAGAPATFCLTYSYK